MRVRKDDMAADRLPDYGMRTWIGWARHAARPDETYPMNQFAVTAAILFAVIIVIGMLYAIGVVKP